MGRWGTQACQRGKQSVENVKREKEELFCFPELAVAEGAKFVFKLRIQPTDGR